MVAMVGAQAIGSPHHYIPLLAPSAGASGASRILALTLADGQSGTVPDGWETHRGWAVAEFPFWNAQECEMVYLGCPSPLWFVHQSAVHFDIHSSLS